MFQRKVVEKNQNTHFVFSNFYQNRAVYEIMWKNLVKPERSEMEIQYGACTLLAEYRHILRICLTFAFPRQRYM